MPLTNTHLQVVVSIVERGGVIGHHSQLAIDCARGQFVICNLNNTGDTG